jgi:hypothetical protein
MIFSLKSSARAACDATTQQAKAHVIRRNFMSLSSRSVRGPNVSLRISLGILGLPARTP